MGETMIEAEQSSRVGYSEAEGAGRRLDALVAEKVFDYKGIRLGTSVWGAVRSPTREEVAMYAAFGVTHETLPVAHYSTDWNAAASVIERVRQFGAQVRIQSRFGFTSWDCEISRGERAATREGASVPEAVALAALAWAAQLAGEARGE